MLHHEICVVQVRLVVKDDGSKWCYMATEKVVHKKGWKESTGGSGSSRAIADAHFEDMWDQLKDCGWEYTLTEKEKKAMIKDAEIPDKYFQKANLAITVWVLFTIDSATSMAVHQNKLYSMVRLSHTSSHISMSYVWKLVSLKPCTMFEMWCYVETYRCEVNETYM